MKPRMLSEVATETGGRIVGEDVVVTSAVTDSRASSPGSLFFALPGSNVDGHDFVADALGRGAPAAVVAHEISSAGSMLVVDDVSVALSRLAAAERRASPARVIGITGSSGKTTTKDFVSAVLAGRFRVKASPGSFNNELGLPLTILGADPDTEVIVCEMGSRGLGHIAELCEIARPDVGIVTNVGLAHIEMFGTRDNIAKAKGELIEALGPHGIAVLAADDPLVRAMADLSPARVITFGLSSDATVRAEGVELDERGLGSFRLVHEGGGLEAHLAIPGEHMVPNALAAAATGVALGVPLAEIVEALAEARTASWRMETFVNSEGIVIVNDAYNANPQSMAAALRTCRWMSRNSRFGAVLGRMAELGDHSAEEHEKVGELAARLRVDRLVTVGEEARTIAISAVREGVEPDNAASYDDADEALDDVRAWARSGDVVLFKGSRVVGLERLAEALR